MTFERIQGNGWMNEVRDNQHYIDKVKFLKKIYIKCLYNLHLVKYYAAEVNRLNLFHIGM